MWAASVAYWSTLPLPEQQRLLRERLQSFICLPASVLARIGECLPPDAQQPYADLLAALRKW